MSDIVQKMEESMVLYHELKSVMDDIETRLKFLDLQKTVQAAAMLAELHEEVLAKDHEILVLLTRTPERLDDLEESLQKRKDLLMNILAQNQRLMPKLKTRLSGYRQELTMIRSGIAGMHGYQHGRDWRGGRINTVN